MPNPRVASCIFCDDIRAEVGNKLSLMGIYGTDILFPMAPPIMFPKFGIVVWIISDIGDIPSKFSIRILGPPDRSEIAKVEAEGEPLFTNTPKPDEFSKHATIRMIIPIANITFQEAGVIEVMVEVEGEEPLRAGRLGVRFNVDPQEAGLSPS